jgi:para-nitrobenzyl esterase
MTLLVELSTRPVQRYLGFSDTYPLVAHSVATNVPSTTSNLPAVQKWLGVPFASAQRFSRPTPFVAHDDIGVVSAHEFGPVPWQPAGIVEKHWVDKKGWLNRDFVGQSEECLSCNILVPEKTRLAGQRIPVLVW